MTESTEEVLRKIVRWCAKNSSRESIFSTPDPQWELNTHSLLDYIVSLGVLTKEQVSEEANQAGDEEAERIREKFNA